MIEASDKEYSRVCREQFIPLILFLCREAGIELPAEKFDYRVEGPRIVTNLLAKGFNARFSTEKRKALK